VVGLAVAIETSFKLLKRHGERLERGPKLEQLEKRIAILYSRDG
jgi:hypothetical protein